jgi:hypothetical protein
MADPQQWNRYAHARNNPLKFSDPWGATVHADGTCPLSTADVPAKVTAFVSCNATDGFSGTVWEGGCVFGFQYGYLYFWQCQPGASIEDPYGNENYDPGGGGGGGGPLIYPGPIVLPPPPTTDPNPSAPNAPSSGGEDSGGGNGGDSDDQGDRQINEIARGIFRPSACTTDWADRFSSARATTEHVMMGLPKKVAGFAVGAAIAKTLKIPTYVSGLVWAATDRSATALTVGLLSGAGVAATSSLVTSIAIEAGVDVGAALRATIIPCTQ